AMAKCNVAGAGAPMALVHVPIVLERPTILPTEIYAVHPSPDHTNPPSVSSGHVAAHGDDVIIDDDV
ncbi:hypothetical protein, partial [Burkholderia sp. SCN-KJ]|uniref:hypothetical protein n=1 Tax=Burkholderia sp. SCN-KJ TaxID=2969248 RepID=UPI002150392B